VVGDAKQYLLDHYKEFDFIWASPPCQTHTTIITSLYKRDTYIPKYPDITLYEMIMFLRFHLKDAKWCIENVVPYYGDVIKPDAIIDRHYYWCNFAISEILVAKDKIISEVKASDLDKIIEDTSKIKNKVQVVRNQVNYETGKHILDCAMGTVQHKQGGLF